MPLPHDTHPLVKLAAEAVEAFVRNREIIAPPVDFFEQYRGKRRRGGDA
jgi:AMMECR1 domain-containing protein